MLQRSLLIGCLTAAIALAGCSSSSRTNSPSTAALPPAKPVSGEFAPGASNTVRVTVLDQEPAQAIQLVGPSGQIWTARTIDRDKVVERNGPAGRYYSPFYDDYADYSYPGYRPSVGLGLGVGTWSGGHTRVGTGIGFGFPLGGGGTYVRDVPTQRYSRSIGTVPILDPEYYRATWPKWRMRAIFSGNRTMELPAPRPPGA